MPRPAVGRRPHFGRAPPGAHEHARLTPHPGTRAEFSPGFLWGAGTSAHQVEGGNTLNDWSRFEQRPGVIADGQVSGAACRHWERFDEDFALAAGDHHNAHRLSLEWSRIEPARDRIDAAAVAHYHAVFAALRRHGLAPIVTLWHFTNPQWIADRGGWENPETIERFTTFVRFCAREFGAEVDWWCTINEPEVYAFRSYSEGIWPPGTRDDRAALRVIAHLLEAHGRAYRVLHEEDRADADGDGRPARVGFAKHWVVLEPDRPWFPPDRLRAHIEHALFNEAVARAPATGRIRLDLPGVPSIRKEPAGLAGSLDWFGLNYYTRWKVRMFSALAHVAPRGATLNDLGWEHYPEGIGRALDAVAPFGFPVLVTENGVADAHDTLRPRALVETLAKVNAAMARGVPVLGYLHWSLLDNFEWADGYRGRFGLYAVDFGAPDRPRTPRPSAALYARIIAAGGIDDALRAEVGAR